MTKLRRTALTPRHMGFVALPPEVVLPPDFELRLPSWAELPPVIRCKSAAQARALTKRGGRTERTVARRCALCDWREEETVTVCADGTPDGHAEVIVEWLGAAHVYYCPGTPGVVAKDLRTKPVYGGIGVTQFPDWQALAYEREGIAGVEFERSFVAQARCQS